MKLNNIKMVNGIKVGTEDNNRYNRYKMINLGLCNDWYGTDRPNKKPEIILECERLKHHITGEMKETSSSTWSCYSTITCNKCLYYYSVDSSG